MPPPKPLNQPKHAPFLNYLSQIPLVLKLFFAYSIILASALPFYFGYQIYPINNTYNPDDMNPECLMFKNLGYIQSRNFLNFTYTLKSKLDTSKSIAPNLFRIQTSGLYFREELRSQNIKDFYQYANNAYSISYELFQEGELNISLKCLDRVFINTTTINISNIPSNSSSYTIFHKNLSLSNICHVGNNTVLFLRNNIRSFTKQISDLKQFQYQNMTISEFLKENKKVKSISSPFIDIHKKSYYQILSEILPFAYRSFSDVNEITINCDENEKNKFSSLFRLYFPRSAEFTSRPINSYCYLENPVAMVNHQAALKNVGLLDVYQSFLQATIQKVDHHEKSDIIIDSLLNSFFSNTDDIKSQINPKLKSKTINFDNLTFSQKVSFLSNSKFMIAFDDSNEIVNAIWMKPGSTLFVLKTNEQQPSDAVSFAAAFGIHTEVIRCVQDDNQAKFVIPIHKIIEIINGLE